MTGARVLAGERSAGDPDDARGQQRDDDAAAQHEECYRRGGENGELPAFAQCLGDAQRPKQRDVRRRPAEPDTADPCPLARDDPQAR